MKTDPVKRAPWKRRPIFLWQLRIFLAVLVLSALSWLPTLLRGSSAYFRHSVPLTASVPTPPPNPCHNRPSPPPLRTSPLPTLFFLHLPKTAGTLMYRVAIQYANRTNGIACSYSTDGDRYPPEYFSQAPVPAAFATGSVPDRVSAAIKARNYPLKARLLAAGGCRTLRGHVTVKTADAIQTPVLSVTIVRDPLARFVSMYEFVVAMVRRRPVVTGWDPWLGGSRSLAAEFANSSSIFHRAFVDDAGQWIARQNIAFSFHFYGILHQLSGLSPRFEGVQDPYHFRMRNDAEMADAAKDNLCATHIVGSQEDMEETWKEFFDKIKPFASWTDQEKRVIHLASVNRTPGRVSRNVDDHLPQRIREELERRLEKEIEVVDFARQIIEYRKWEREHAR